MLLNDAHCHFFSTGFLAALGRQLKEPTVEQPHVLALRKLGWDAPGSNEDLADRWARALDDAGVARAVLIASVPGDGHAVSVAVRRHPTRFVGWFMVDPTEAESSVRMTETIEQGGLRGVCLFPAMHRFSVQDERVRRVFDVAAARPGTTVFIHCGVLTVGVRAKLGLPSRFDISLGNPLHIHELALEYPTVPIVIPHFGAGLFRETLMLADLCPNVYLDTSSSNRWITYHPGLTLDSVLQQALAVVGPDRLLFGSDSSFFPRGWVSGVYTEQRAVLDRLGAGEDVRAKLFAGNFDRLFPRHPTSFRLDIARTAE
jgi:predicted TIM-barrel fold metal-dependent hydrolase